MNSAGGVFDDDEVEGAVSEPFLTLKSPKDQRRQCCLTRKVVVSEHTCSGRIATGCLRVTSSAGMIKEEWVAIEKGRISSTRLNDCK